MARLSWPGWLLIYKDGLPVLNTFWKHNGSTQIKKSNKHKLGLHGRIRAAQTSALTKAARRLNLCSNVSIQRLEEIYQILFVLNNFMKNLLNVLIRTISWSTSSSYLDFSTPRPISICLSMSNRSNHYFIVNDFSSCQCIIFCLVAYVNLY